MRDWALPPTDTYFRGPGVLNERGFQVEHLLAAFRFVRSWRTAVDGGAHVGTWSVELAARFARVLSFEPAPDTYQCLERNTAGLLNVRTIRAALGAEHTYGAIKEDHTREGNTGARYLAAGGVGDVLVQTLDEHGLDDLDLLKLDVEGSELQALIGARHTIERCRPVVIIEVKDLGRGGDPEEAVRYLKSLRYVEVTRNRNDRVYVQG